MSLTTPTPGTMLGLAARDNRRTQKKASKPRSPIRARVRTIMRALLATVALTIGMVGLSTSSAQAWPWDDMKDNITATVKNICGPNDVPAQASYTNIDTIAGLNQGEPREGYRSTIKPDFTQDEAGGQGGNGMERLQRVYGEKGDVIAKPTYERYGFSTLQWHSYGNDCMSPTLVMSPLANMSLMSMVHVPMMISMAFLNFVMDNVLYTGFSALMQPFIGAMYEIFEPWIYVLVPIGIFVTWLASRHSLQATLKAGGWGVFILSVYLLMGESTSQVVSWGTNIVTEVSGSAACKMNAAANGGQEDGEDCDASDPVKAVQQALWYGVPYQTWHLGQVGEHQADLDEEALDKGEVGWGPALLNGQYVGVNEEGGIDDTGKKVIQATSTWNAATYSPDGDESKNLKWGKNNQWDKVPYLANIKIMCDDRDNGDDTPGDNDNAMRRWMYNGASGTSYCDSAGADTSAMIPHIQGDQYNKQILIAMSGLTGVTAVALTIVGSAIYLGFQKMMFFFLLFLAPVVLLVSSLGDRKRRPFAVRYAEIVGVNLLKQVAAVCIVLFVSYAMASLFGSSTFGHIPWIMKPHAALLFFLALAFLAFPLKNMVKGAIQGDTSVLDKQATAPQRAMKTTAKVVGIGAAAAATGGIGLAAAGGVGGVGTAVAAAGGKGAVMGKAGSMLGQAGRVMGIGSKTGRAMRASGALLKAGRGIAESQDTKKGQKAALSQAAQGLLGNSKTRGKYLDQDGKLLPNAQKMAEQDAQKMADKGQKTDRASKAQDARMKAFFSGYKAEHGEFHKEDPESPENQRAARADKEREKRQAKADADRGSAMGSSKPASADGPSSQGQSPAQNYERYAEQARGNLSGPAFSREMDYNVNTVRSGEDVLHNAGLTKQQVVADPTVLLSDSAYDGGRTTSMDPFHPATPALNELRFAGNSGTESDIEGAVAKAVDAISRHGVPDQIGGVHSIGDRAANFEPVQLLGAMPSLTSDASWQERADAAHTMQAAQVAMPQDFTARESVQSYTDALSNPTVDPATLSAMKETTMAEISNAMSAQLGAAGASAMAAGIAGSMAGGSYDDGDGYDAPRPQGDSSGGVSPSDLREAVADGVRDANFDRGVADAATSGPTESTTSRTEPPASPAAPSDEGYTPAKPSTPPPADDIYDESDEDAPLIFRPRRRRDRRRQEWSEDEDGEY